MALEKLTKCPYYVSDKAEQSYLGKGETRKAIVICSIETCPYKKQGLKLENRDGIIYICKSNGFIKPEEAGLN